MLIVWQAQEGCILCVVMFEGEFVTSINFLHYGGECVITILLCMFQSHAVCGLDSKKKNCSPINVDTLITKDLCLTVVFWLYKYINLVLLKVHHNYDTPYMQSHSSEAALATKLILATSDLTFGYI